MKFVVRGLVGGGVLGSTVDRLHKIAVCWLNIARNIFFSIWMSAYVSFLGTYLSVIHIGTVMLWCKPAVLCQT